MPERRYKRDIKVVIKGWFLGFFLITLVLPATAQENFRVMFYNVENLFDTEDNPQKNDNEFLPEGTRKWTPGRYRNKLNNLAKVISSAGEWGYPALVGMCEVENEKVLEDLTRSTSLKKARYRYVVTDSPDQRGINTALLYQHDCFRLLSWKPVRITFPTNKNKKTRDILHVTGEVQSRDTLDVFVCHFPSRRGGESESEPDRIHVASQLRSSVDSLFRIRVRANIIIMGDFNDEPTNKSISEVLQTNPLGLTPDSRSLYNLFYHFEKQRNRGSYKYGRDWNMLDQIIVSGDLVSGQESRLRALSHTATIFSREFMQTEDLKNGGKRPRKTFHGYKHEGGYSDHYPVFVDLKIPQVLWQ